MTILYQKQRIEVEEVEEIGGVLDDLYYFTDRLLRDADGQYFLHQTRYSKMPPNAEENLNDQMSLAAESELLLRRLNAFRDQHEKPRSTVKRITTKTALFWCARNMLNDAKIKTALRRCISNQLADVR